MNCLWCQRESDTLGRCPACRDAMNARDEAARNVVRACLNYYHLARVLTDADPNLQQALADIRQETEAYLRGVDRVTSLLARVVWE